MATAIATRIILDRAINGSTNGTRNSTSHGGAAFIEGFIFQDSKSIRTSTVILASFNLLAAFATAARILYDCYWASKRSSPNFRASKLFILSIHPAETFPLILSVGIFIQGLLFAGVQGTGLKSLDIKGCGTIAQFMWPALFIVPFIHSAFSVECAIRSLRKNAFRARGKYDVAICGGIVGLLLMATWVYSHVVREQDVCFASLVWYISRYGAETLILLSVSAGLTLFSTITIFVRLSKAATIDRQQRIAASRIVYYNVLGLVSLGFVVPYFVSVTVSTGNIKLSMMATVVLNLSGLMAGLLQMFLRSRTAAISFEMTTGPWPRGKQDVGMSSFNGGAFNKQLASPLSAQPIPAELDGQQASRDGMPSPVRVLARAASLESLDAFPFKPIQYDGVNTKADELGHAMPVIPESIISSLPGSAKRTHMRKQSYSLFPGNATASPVKPAVPAIQNEPMSKYSTQNFAADDMDELKPPPAIHYGHRRDSSVVSSATVQIGLRISQAPPQSRDTNTHQSSVPSASYDPNSLSPTSPLSPKMIPIAFSFRPGSPPPASSRPPKGPSPLQMNAITANPPAGTADPNKTLPPTPKNPSFNFSFPKVRIPSTTQLSPVTYSPQKQSPTPAASSAGSAPSPQSRAAAAAPPPATSPRRAPLPSSPRPPANPQPDLRQSTNKEGWI